MSGVAKLYGSCFRETGCVPAVSRRQHAVEKIDACGDGVEDVLRPADTHQVAWPVVAAGGGRHLECVPDLVAVFADADPADGVSVEIERQQFVGAFGAKISVRPSLDDAEERLIVAAVRRLAPPGPVDGAADRIGNVRPSRQATTDSGPDTSPRRRRALPGWSLARSGVSSSKPAVDVRAEGHALSRKSALRAARLNT